MKHTLAWLDHDDRQGHDRLPAGAHLHADQRRRLYRAESSGFTERVIEHRWSNSRCRRIPRSPKARPGRIRPRRKARARIPHLSLESGRRQQPAHRHLLRRYRRLRADGARRADLDQEQRRPDADLPPLLPRRHLRLLRDEHRRHQHARLHQGDGRDQRRGAHLSAAAHAGGEGPGARPHQFLRPARLDRAVAADRVADAAEGMEAEPRRPRRSSTGSTSASCAPAARPSARAIGGIPTAISARRRCCRRSAGSSTRATRRPASGSTISKTRSGSIAATPS